MGLSQILNVAKWPRRRPCPRLDPCFDGRFSGSWGGQRAVSGYRGL